MLIILSDFFYQIISEKALYISKDICSIKKVYLYDLKFNFLFNHQGYVRISPNFPSNTLGMSWKNHVNCFAGKQAYSFEILLIPQRANQNRSKSNFSSSYSCLTVSYPIEWSGIVQNVVVKLLTSSFGFSCEFHFTAVWQCAI